MNSITVGGVTTTIVGDLALIRERHERALPGLRKGRADSAVLASAYDVPILLRILDAVTEERDAAQVPLEERIRLYREGRNA